MMSISLVKT